MIESILVYSLSIFSAYWLVNYAEITVNWRKWSEFLPEWAQKVIQCSFCSAFWTMVAFTLFCGVNPVLIAAVPPVMMFWNLIYLNLKGVCDK